MLKDTDPEASQALLVSAAEKGSKLAEYLYGMQLKETSPMKAEKLFTMSYKHGYIPAGMELGLLRTNSGRFDEAKELLEEACQAGVPGSSDAIDEYNKAVKSHNWWVFIWNLIAIAITASIIISAWH